MTTQTQNQKIRPSEIPEEKTIVPQVTIHQVKIRTMRALAILEDNEILKWTMPDGRVYFTMDVKVNGFQVSMFSETLEKPEDSD